MDNKNKEYAQIALDHGLHFSHGGMIHKNLIGILNGSKSIFVDLVWNGNIPVGCGIVTRDDYNIFILPEYRRMGYGKQLAVKLKQIANEKFPNNFPMGCSHSLESFVFFKKANIPCTTEIAFSYSPSEIIRELGDNETSKKVIALFKQIVMQETKEQSNAYA